MSDYDVIVIGAGPGGYVAAIRAAQLGLKAAVVEREHLGGICLNWGCIPTKALLKSADMLDSVRHAAEFGVTVGAPVANLPAMVQRSREVSAKLNAGVGFLMGKNKIDVIWGEAKVTAPGRVTVQAPAKPAVQPQHPAPKKTLGAGTYSAKHIILATGARPRVLPGLEPDSDRIWTYFEALKPKTLPKSLIVVGSGAIGTEFASFFARLGTQVTVIEAMDRVLPAEDAEIAALARKRLEKTGISFLEGAMVESARKTASEVTARIKLKDGSTVEKTAEVLLSAAGVVGNAEGLGLEALGVTLDRGCVKVDGRGQSSVPGIWAIGDVAGPPMLAHKASHDALTTLAAIAGEEVHPLLPSSIPRCTYCDPQIASIGLTEAQAEATGRKLRIGRFPFAANGKAIAMGEAEGLVKVIFDEATGELLGAHMVGPEVTEILAALSIGMSVEATDEALAQAVLAHPTLSESLHEAVLSALGRAIHIA
ncbi:dihydrolipoyl dehydrogenase [Stagnihabitans tardus]|uniref:Dihydrolipoyl dehydrogenase n=1 Tax=Stagnihabitans tardus TaxID=2699202 RepID=A0AAE4YDD5_9RHOB|nr:dihydrolipoyl dehydrogenase [Stagnihabitans tardus]NBZ89396.1 dihydrolipoyl dehydrogenase [Stagnihabitans tardus]